MKSKFKSPYRYLKSSSDRLLVRFDKGRLQEIKESGNRSFALEVIKNGKTGSASSNQPDDRTLFKKAQASSIFGEKISYKYPTPEKPSAAKTYSPEVAKLTPDHLVGVGKAIIKKIKEYNPEILVDIFLSKNQSRLSLEISSGANSQRQATLFDISLAGELVKKGDVLQIENYFVWRDQLFNMDKFVDEIIEKFNLSKKVVKNPGGKMPVVFTPDSLATLLGPVEVACSAKSVYKKVSQWSDKVGKHVADKRFTLVDDPTIDFAVGSTNFDDESFAAKPLILIENGVLQNFFTDLNYAKKLKIKPNGRGFGIPTSPGLTNLIVSPGSKSSKDIIKGVKGGILIDQILGGGQDSPYSGDFTISVHLGFLIEDGKIAGRIKDTLVSGNTFEMLKNQIGEISSDRKWVGGSANLPFISFEGVNVVGK